MDHSPRAMHGLYWPSDSIMFLRDRRQFLQSSLALLWPRPDRRVRTAIARRIRARQRFTLGVMATGSEQAYASRVAAIRAGLHDIGYVEGENVTFEYRYGEGGNETGARQPGEDIGRRTSGPSSSRRATAGIRRHDGHDDDPDRHGRGQC